MTIPLIAPEGAADTGRALAAIPSPDVSSISLGPVTIHFYALCILAGVVVAVFWAERRWSAMGGERGTMMDLAVPAVLLGLVGGRLYHVITDYQLYFGPGRDPIQALNIRSGGLGIWGAVALGAVGVWYVARRRGLSMSKLSFAIAPTIPLAQALGRWGNYFNQELFGAPTDLPWAVRVSLDYTYNANGEPRPGMQPLPGSTTEYHTTYHPTFLYEFLWCLALAALLAWLGRRFEDRLGGGRLFALYIMGYCVGRFWIEYLRVDPAHEILGLRLNNWTSVLLFAGALAYFWWAGRRMDRFSTRVVPVGHDSGTQVFDTDPASSDDPAAETTAVDDPDRTRAATADPTVVDDGATAPRPEAGGADGARS
ncbi:prolipoprotein diacylglyceryl transferase [Streptomonospora nanhaiensis]|uniref:prolipoprotein diacylglyceryl transferase n=1 Tax=Streptomonospora nanhaiensis TaxID=1323731 RepID=UPI001C99584D|nr:prolipoprotein diacylglyceryl transferase [Streptomonospora nanhaiensis]MBX9391026.1 prolipoprotein diacylglyceryl transferase [Streptomonospora nanhaiensis]